MSRVWLSFNVLNIKRKTFHVSCTNNTNALFLKNVFYNKLIFPFLQSVTVSTRLLSSPPTHLCDKVHICHLDLSVQMSIGCSRSFSLGVNRLALCKSLTFLKHFIKKTLSFFVNITLLVWLWPYLTTAEIFIQLVFWSAIKVIALRPHLYKPGHMCHHSAQTCRNSSWSFSSSEVCLAARRLGAPGADWVTGVDARLIKDVLLTFVAALKRQDAAIFPHYVGRQVGSPMEVVADSVVMAEFDPGRLEQRSEKMDVQNRLCLKWH